jgi:DNA-binding transcriptional ArsR family regulator
MIERHEIPSLPAPLVVARSDEALQLALPEGPAVTFVPIWLPALTRQRVGEIVERASDEMPRRLFVSFRRSSPEARAALRDAGISFAGEDGHVYVRAPGILVERDDRKATRATDATVLAIGPDSGVRNPFANRGSRVARWMLIHHEQTFSPTSLAQAIDLNPAAVSRLLTALEDAAFIRAEGSRARRGRQRSVRLARPIALLEEWLPLWQRRRIQRWRWDIGARDVDEALGLLRAVDETDGWAVGGLVGAATVRRAVEPVAVSVWASPTAVEQLAAALDPIDTGDARGSLEVAVAPDPWTLRLARPVGGLPVADAVQLWLDCSSEGERSLEAADAVAREIGWS